VLPEIDDSIEVKKDEVLFEQESPISPITRVALGSGTQFERAVIPELDRLWRKKLYALVAESLSLLYVGVTRPRQILHLVVPAPKKEPKASAAGIVIESLSNGEGQQVLFGASDVVIEQRAPIKRSVRTFNSRVNFVKTEGERGLTRVSPAQLKDKFQLSDPRVYKVGQNARERGTALHLLFEQIGWLDDFNLESLKTETILEYLGTDTARTIIDEFAAMIRNQTIVSELSKARFSKYDRVNLYREQKFAVQQDDRIVSGVIDRLVVGYSGSNPVWAEIIDYKSDKLDSPNSLAERVELYREQIALYALGARALIGCDLGIATKIIFLDGPVMVDCS
jgi:ATP-dependent exoDNAse (exonuclease V) beta subunit